MGVIEIPLWIHHGDDENTSTSSALMVNGNTGNDGENSTSMADEWFLHFDSKKNTKCPIYSCDILNDLLATGGGDGKVRLWRISTNNGKHENIENDLPGTNPIITTTTTTTTTDDDGDEDDEMYECLSDHEDVNPKVVKVLSSGSSALCVRFSKKGNYLASSGDDGFLHIHHNNNANECDWKKVKSWKGHELDVVGLAWAPDDSCLASCSLDQHFPICIWKNTTTTTVSSTNDSIVLKNQHTSHVKGLIFCPTGKYLMTYGDDGRIVFWCTRSWTCTNSVSLSSSSMSTLFRRLDVSPDATHVCCTNATMKNRHVARMIPRNSTSSSSMGDNKPTCLVGHEQSIVCAKYFPYLLNSGKDDDGYATWLALGDKSGFVTVWSTTSSRPLLKVQCSESGNTITDLVWDFHGVLYVSLLDGYIVKLHIPSSHTKYSKENVARLFSNLYGIEGYSPGYYHQQNQQEEIPNLILTEQEENTFAKHTLTYTYNNNNSKETNNCNHDGAFTKHTVPQQQPQPQQQKITTKNGKKRITPISMNNTPATTTPTNLSMKKKPKTLLEQALESADKASSITSLASLPSSTAISSTQTQAKIKKKKSLFSIPIPSTTFIVECSNNGNTTLMIRQDRKIIFQEQFVNHIGTSLVATKSRVVLGTSQGHLYIYNLHIVPKKSKLMEEEENDDDNVTMIVQKDIPPMIMDSSIHSTLLKDDLLLVVTEEQYHCYLYDLKELTLIYKTKVPKNILHQLVRVEWFQEKSFLVIVTLPFRQQQKQKNQTITQKQVWYYNISMQTFMRLADSHAHLLSKYVHTYYENNNGEGTTSKPILAEYEQVLQRSHPSSTKYLLERMLNHHQNQPCTHATWAHLQDRLVTTKHLLPSTKNEYNHWLKLYIQHLAAQQNSESELSWLTEHFVSNQKSSDSSTLSTKELLQDIILPTLSEHSHMHDLLQELSLYFNTL